MLLSPSSNYTQNSISSIFRGKKDNSELTFVQHTILFFVLLPIFSSYSIYKINQNQSYTSFGKKNIFQTTKSLLLIGIPRLPFGLFFFLVLLLLFHLNWTTRKGAAISLDRSSFQPKWHNTKYSIWQSGTCSSLNRIFRWTEKNQIFLLCICTGTMCVCVCMWNAICCMCRISLKWFCTLLHFISFNSASLLFYALVKWFNFQSECAYRSWTAVLLFRRSKMVIDCGLLWFPYITCPLTKPNQCEFEKLEAWKWRVK